jgi:hypothetical protein
VLLILRWTMEFARHLLNRWFISPLDQQLPGMMPSWTQQAQSPCRPRIISIAIFKSAKLIEFFDMHGILSPGPSD